MSAPFTYAASLSYAPDTGQPEAKRPINLTSSYDSLAEFTYKLTGAGSQAVDLGTIATLGAKLISIEVDPDVSPSALPVLVQFNGGGTDGQLEISQGGFLTLGSPKPTAAGVLSMIIVHATTAVVRVRVLG